MRPAKAAVASVLVQGQRGICPDPAAKEGQTFWLRSAVCTSLCPRGCGQRMQPLFRLRPVVLSAADLDSLAPHPLAWRPTLPLQLFLDCLQTGEGIALVSQPGQLLNSLGRLHC